MRLFWDERAWEEYLYWQTQDKKTLRRINAILKDIQRSTFELFQSAAEPRGIVLKLRRKARKSKG